MQNLFRVISTLCAINFAFVLLQRIIDDILFVNAKDANTKVFYLKMKGDYYRYLAEISHSDARKEGEFNIIVLHTS